jgi:serine protease
VTLKEHIALYPDRYDGWKDPSADAIRLFGSNWAFAAIGKKTAAAAEGHFRFRAEALWGSTNLEDYRNQNVFALDLNVSTGVHHKRYPIRGRVPLDNPPDLLVQQIAGGRKLFQLLQGRIEVRVYEEEVGRREMLEEVRRKLGLKEPPTENLRIFLYPDGVCFHGAIHIPWSDKALPGWFKFATRGAAVPGAPPGDATGGLVLCLDSALPGNAAYEEAWRAAVQPLGKLFQQDRPGGARWLALDRTGDIALESFFWPGAYLRDKPYFSRPADGPLLLESSAVRVRVSPAPAGVEAIAGLDILGDRLSIARTEEGRLRVTTAGNAPAGPLRYRFSNLEDPGDVEELRLGTGPEDDPRLVLAVPLIETAAFLRRSSGMPERDWRGEREDGAVEVDPVGPLWTFTPIENGLLHWPFPDATMEGLESLVEQLVERPSLAKPPTGGAPVAGAVLVGNEPSLGGHDSEQRRWQLSITEGAVGWFELLFTRAKVVSSASSADTESWSLSNAQVAVGDCAIALTGAVPVIPFRQTAQRLLPDHDERALRLTSLRAVSPNLLRGLERRMWRHAEEKANPESARIVQARLVIRDFRVSPTDAAVTVRGRADLTCKIRSSAKQDAGLRPWLWTRFPHLPTVQTMPLAVSGEAAFHPSGSRELHPLIRTAAATELRYSFENAFEMRKVAPRLVTTADYESATEIDPNTGKISAVVGEIGMTVLTLPSVTLFPQAKQEPDPARLPAPDGTVWPAGNGKPLAGGASGAVACRLELRHDLAWCDERYAIAKADSPDDDHHRLSASFTPLANNGPQSGSGNTSYSAVWGQVNRLAALCATDDRALVTWSGDPQAPVLSLTGFRGGESLEIERLSLSTALELNGPSLASGGKVLITLRDKKHARDVHPKEGLITLAGLPASGDLSGYSGGLAGAEYDFGTLAASNEKPAPFLDQRSLASTPLEPVGVVHRHRVGGAILHSLPSRVAVGEGKDLLWLWFVDVPEAPAADSPPEKWGDYDNDHRSGFRWGVAAEAGTIESCIPWRSGIQFEPLQLTGFAPGNGRTFAVTIKGRLGLAVRAQAAAKRGAEKQQEWEFLPQVLNQGEALATLAITLKPDGVSTWTITPAATTILRLERSGPDDAPPALLALAPDLRSASLHFDLFGQAAKLDFAKPTDDGNVLCFRVSRQRPPDGVAVWWRDAEVTLSPEGPQVQLCWECRFDTGKQGMRAVLTGDVTHPHYRWATAKGLTFTLFSGVSGASWPVIAEQFSFGAGGLALVWNSVKAKPEGALPGDSWIARFQDGGHAGALLGLIRPRASADFDCDDFQLSWEAKLGSSLRLRAGAALSRTLDVFLDGTVEVRNDAAEDGLTHTAVLQFESARVTWDGAEARSAAQVLHTLGKKDDKGAAAELKLPTVQWIGLSKDRIRFAAAMIVEGTGGGDALLVILPASDAGGHNAETWALSCRALPPLSPAIREAAQVALATALDDRIASGGDWAARLLRDGGSLVEPPSAGDAGRLDKLFALARHGPLHVHALTFPEGWAAAKDTSYATYLATLARQLVRLMVGVPPKLFEERSRKGYALHGPDVHARKIVRLAREASVSVPAPPDAGAPPLTPALERWMDRLLAFDAPWAAHAVLTLYEAGDGIARFCVPTRKVARSTWPAPAAPWAPDVEPVTDPHRLPVPPAGAVLAIAYIPSAVRAVALHYRDERNAGPERPEAALSAHGLQRMWQLHGAGPHYREDQDFWLGMRQKVAFRPAQAWRRGSTQRLTAKLTPAAAQAASPAKIPATRLSDHGVGTRSLGQFFAPAQLILRDISARSGVWHSRRLGLASGTLALDHRARSTARLLAAPELPFHARTPRPPLTGAHDRLRASEFEPAGSVLATEPQFILYGPRKHAPTAPLPPKAVTRDPLSESAWIGTVEKPGAGLIGRNWSGMIELRLVPLGDTRADQQWELVSATVQVDGVRFHLEPSAEPPPAPGQGQFGRKFMLDGRAAQEGRRSFAEHVAGLRLSTRARVECEFKLPDALRIHRWAVFEMLVAPGGSRTPERPVYIRFEDPAYNDRLTLPAKFAPTGDEVQFCADRDTVRPDDRLTVAWRRVRGEVAAPSCFYVSVVRQVRWPNGQTGSVTMDLGPVNAVSEGGEAWAVIECAKLHLDPAGPAGEQLDRLVVGDTLRVSTDATGDSRARTLSFDVTREPLLPGNVAAFALLCFDAKKNSISAPLHAQSPAPANLELIDPRDLFTGVARFRAVYQWIHFAPAGGADLRYFVQKIAGDGSSFLPADLTAWGQAPQTGPTSLQRLLRRRRSADGEELIVELVFETEQQGDDVRAAISLVLPRIAFSVEEALRRESGTIWFVTLPERTADGREADGFEFARTLARNIGAIEGNLVTTDSVIGAAAVLGGEKAERAGVCGTPRAEFPKAWPHAMIGIERAWQKTRGAGVRIGHIDTGYTDHVETCGVFDMDAQLNLLERAAPNDASDRFSSEFPQAHRGHGTVVASAIASRGGIGPDATTTEPGSVTGAAPEATLVPIRAIKSVITVRQSTLSHAISGAVKANCQVIAMCLGGPARVRGVELALREAVRRGVVVVCAAGNCWWWTVFPARYTLQGLSAAVAAVGPSRDPWGMTPRFGPITMAAPGENVWAGIKRSPTAPNDSVDPTQGTTLATSITSGLAALWIAHHGHDNLRELASRKNTTVQALFLRAVIAASVPEDDWSESDRRRLGAGIVRADVLLDLDPAKLQVQKDDIPSTETMPTLELLREFVAESDKPAALEVDASLADVASELIWARHLAGAAAGVRARNKQLVPDLRQTRLSATANERLLGKERLRAMIENWPLE